MVLKAHRKVRREVRADGPVLKFWAPCPMGEWGVASHPTPSIVVVLNGAAIPCTRAACARSARTARGRSSEAHTGMFDTMVMVVVRVPFFCDAIQLSATEATQSVLRFETTFAGILFQGHARRSRFEVW